MLCQYDNGLSLSCFDGRCYLPFVADGMPLMCDVVDVITTYVVLMADVICHWWQME